MRCKANNWRHAAGVKCMLQSNVSKCVANSVLKIERNTWFGNMQMPNHKTECQYNSKVNATNSHSHAREFILSLAVNRTARNIDKSRSIQCFFFWISQIVTVLFPCERSNERVNIFTNSSAKNKVKE